MTRCDQAESPSASHVDLHDTDLHPALVGRWDVDLAPSDHTMGHFSNHVRSEKKKVLRCVQAPYTKREACL